MIIEINFLVNIPTYRRMVTQVYGTNIASNISLNILKIKSKTVGGEI